MKVSILKLNDKTMGIFVNHHDVIETLMTTYSKSVSSIIRPVGTAASGYRGKGES